MMTMTTTTTTRHCSSSSFPSLCCCCCHSKSNKRLLLWLKIVSTVVVVLLMSSTRNFIQTTTAFAFVVVTSSSSRPRRRLASASTAAVMNGRRVAVWKTSSSSTTTTTTSSSSQRFLRLLASKSDNDGDDEDEDEGLLMDNDDGEENTGKSSSSSSSSKKVMSRLSFDLDAALFCGGLAFDAYVAPPETSSRWEKGSQGLKVAFISANFTRNLYKGLVEVTVQKCTNLPDEEAKSSSTLERIATGKGVDAAVLVAAVEGSWKQDVAILEKQQYHDGIVDLTGAAHVVRTPTAWANVDERKSTMSGRQFGRKASPFHIPASLGKGSEAVWPQADPMYLYVQDPATVRLVFTILDDDRIGGGTPIGSTYKRLTSLIPQAAWSTETLMNNLKKELLDKIKSGNMDVLKDASQIQLDGPNKASWEGVLKLTSKARKKDKNSQIMAGAAAGAAVAGPIGAAAGAILGSLYEGQVQGSIHVKIRYLPIPPSPTKRKQYIVTGGMPGIDWGDLFVKHREKQCQIQHGHDKKGEDVVNNKERSPFELSDLEHCFFVNHDKTGATCSVYCSHESKLIVVSFRGTCAPIDLLTDASILQEAWCTGDDVNIQDIPKVHAGFRTSLDSISRRLKELILATVAPGEEIKNYDMIVTGHSLGGALATLFTADIGQYGIDAGRGLPQTEESEPWWKSVASTFMGQIAQIDDTREPPRPKTLRLYSFGSPRVGNNAFADLFDALTAEGFIDQAYRIVNGEDVVARMPRTVNALVFGEVRYEHCGPTALISQPQEDKDEGGVVARPATQTAPLLWVEGESDDTRCPVRDGIALTSPTAEGSLLGDLVSATKDTFDDVQGEGSSILNKFTSAFEQVSTRLKSITAPDIISVLGIDRNFSEREIKLIQSLMEGKALAHHMEDQYYGGMGRASGFLTLVGQPIVDLEEKDTVV